MIKTMKQKMFLVILLTVIFAFISPSQAQSITEIEEMNFGQGVVKNNDAQYTIELGADGSYNADPEIVFTNTPDPGEYLATGLPASTPIINVTVSVIQQVVGDGEDFTIDNFDIDHPASTNASGELPIYLGARLTTTGTGINYTGDTTFNGIFNLIITY